MLKMIPNKGWLYTLCKLPLYSRAYGGSWKRIAKRYPIRGRIARFLYE